MKKIIVLFVIIYSINISAQYTGIINSNRPSLSESPYAVGTKVLQVEAGGFYYNNKLSLDETFLTDSFGSDVFLRYSNFLEKLEINVGFRYQNDRKIFKDPNLVNPEPISGISKLTLGAKYLIYSAKYKDSKKEIRSWKKKFATDWSRLIPSVGVAIGWNSNYLSDAYKAEAMSFKGAVLLQNDINERFVILTNLIVDNISQEHLEYAYILTSTLAVTEKWSIFGEHQGVFKKNQDAEYWLGGGAAYLFNRNTQFDVSLKSNVVSNEFSNLYVTLGASWRMDRHNHDKLQGTKKLSGQRKSFFKRLFQKGRRKKPKLGKIKIKKRKVQKTRRPKKAKRGTPSFFGKKKKKKKKRKK